MAIQRVDGYVYSCRDCILMGPHRKRRGEALQDEIDHHRQVPETGCTCPVLNGHQHHRIGCDAWRRHLVAMANENTSQEGSP